MTVHVFLDTNIFLNFFHYSKEDLDSLSNVFGSHQHGAATVYLTQQVRDEFARNREHKIKDALKRFKEAKLPQLPSFMKQYAEHEEIRQRSGELQELMKAISAKVDTDVATKNLSADSLMREIFSRSTMANTTDAVFFAARKRMAVGNPPGKNDSIGDAINWNILLEKVPDNEDIHVVSEDGDYFSALNEFAPHGFLSEEWYEKKRSKLHVYRSLSQFLKEHFDGVAFSYDSKKEVLIEELFDCRSFSATHETIASLENFTYFSQREVERILAAAHTNNQFGWIVTDTDVSAFLHRVAVPRMSNLRDEALRSLLEKVVEDRRTNAVLHSA